MLRQGFLLCIFGCPKTNSVDQADLRLRDPSVSAFHMIGVKVCTITQFFVICMYVCMYVYVCVYICIYRFLNPLNKLRLFQSSFIKLGLQSPNFLCGSNSHPPMQFYSFLQHTLHPLASYVQSFNVLGTESHLHLQVAFQKLTK